jgi:hypothetical protein
VPFRCMSVLYAQLTLSENYVRADQMRNYCISLKHQPLLTVPFISNELTMYAIISLELTRVTLSSHNNSRYLLRARSARQYCVRTRLLISTK